MDNTIRVFSGRTFCPEDIELISWAVKTYPTLPRGELISTICELLDWTTPSGRAKFDRCSRFLDQLDSEGIVRLSPKQVRKPGMPIKLKVDKMDFDTTPISGNLGSLKPIRLVIARVGEDLNRCRSYVDQYHTLGFKRPFGSRLQYFIKSGDLELGCIQFSASSWALKDRDDWIGWNIEDKKQRLHLIINNSRYLIFPWVQVKNLASKALSLAAKQIKDDWLREFCYAPVLLETFVDREHFEGTCYRAANWLYLGQTKGKGRNATSHKPDRSKKDIYVYPLEKNFRAYLNGEIPYKAVDPDE
jgi:hypothetical protein